MLAVQQPQPNSGGVFSFGTKTGVSGLVPLQKEQIQFVAGTSLHNPNLGRLHQTQNLGLCLPQQRVQYSLNPKVVFE